MTNEQWELIFERLQSDISDRNSLKRAWAQVDQEEIDQEISPAWKRIIEEVLAGQ